MVVILDKELQRELDEDRLRREMLKINDERGLIEMVDTSELESFLNEKSAKEGDEVEIIGAGVIENKVDKESERKYKVLNLPIKVNDRELIYSPNRDAMPILQKAFGMSTDKWVGKTFKVKFYPKTAFGVTKTAILPVIE